MHDDQVRAHGGRPGIRDAALIDSALERPRNRWHYGEDADLFDLAAAYAFGMARNHPYIDGNKRIAFLCSAVFLEMNGLRLDADPAEVGDFITGLAAGTVTEAELATWFRRNASLSRPPSTAAEPSAPGPGSRSSPS
jgi:death-on-curing protein